MLVALRRLGFQTLRIKGSHHYLQHPDGRSTVIPVHSGEDIGPGLLGKVLRDTKVSRTELALHL